MTNIMNMHSSKNANKSPRNHMVGTTTKTTTAVTIATTIMLVAMINVQAVFAQTNSDKDKQLNAWKSLFDSTNGENWEFCAGSRENPCSCSQGPNKRVACDSNGFIVEIHLQGNNLEGEFPVAELKALFELGNLKTINFQWNYLTVDSDCADLQTCHEQGFSCTLPPAVDLCEANDRVLWEEFYDTLGGDQWERCGDPQYRSNPCNCGTGPNRRVECANGGGYISKIILRNNNFQGTEFPASILNEMMKFGELHEIELGNNDNFEADGCVIMPECWKEGVICNLPQGFEVCDETNAPTPGPTTTPPTGSPIAPPTGTPTTTPPTTAPPTSPPTSAPTTKPPTKAPTTKPPTNAPTTSPPSNPPTTTPAPSASSRDPAPSNPPTFKPDGNTDTDSEGDDDGEDYYDTRSGAIQGSVASQTGLMIISVFVGVVTVFM